MLEIRSLHKTYRGGTTALAEVSLTQGEGVLGLLGANGAGKTTLLSIIATVVKPTSGTVLWEGKDVVAEPGAVRRALGYLPQDFGVYDRLTAREFLSYLGRLKGISESALAARVGSMLELVNLHGVADRRLGGFSGGMRQRVGIAQALLGDPKLLIVDEPTAGLDPEERVRFRNLLAEIAHGRLVILSTHIVSDVEAVASRIAVLRRGTVLAVEAPEEILKRAAGRVFSTVVPSEGVAEVQKRVAVAGLVRRAEGVHVRFVAPAGSPIEGAVPVEPTLEDAYLLVNQDAAGAA